MGAVYVVNPKAGRGRGARIARELPGLLGERGLSGTIARTGGRRDAIDIARDAARTSDLVVAVGGDGTAHEVVNGVAGTEATLGLLPVGTGNDFALALGIPTRPGLALDVIAAGHERWIDLGRADDLWFANSLGLGFEAQVTVESTMVAGLRGFAVYLWAVARALRHLTCPDLKIVADGRRRSGRCLLVCIGNGPRVGGGFYLTPEARNDDGILDLCLVEAMGRWGVLRTLPRALRGTHVSDPRVEMLRARNIEIESEDGFPFHADGEVIDTARRRLRVHVVPGALKVIAPVA